jgi:hypothetical protein
MPVGKINGDLRFALLQMEEYKKKDLDIAKKLNRDIVVVLRVHIEAGNRPLLRD